MKTEIGEGGARRSERASDFFTNGYFDRDGAAWVATCVHRWDRLPDRVTRHPVKPGDRGWWGWFRRSAAH